MDFVPVIFTRRHHLGSLAMRGFLWSQWSHCAIVDDLEIIEAAFGAGVRVRPTAELIAEASEHEIIFIPVPDRATRDAVIEAARNEAGKPYDWRGVIGFIPRRNWHDNGAWFCSELVAYAFDAAGVPLFRCDPHRVTPRDLYLPRFGKVARGATL